MSRASLFGSPLFVGFEDLEELLERITKSSSDGYPPYNIEQLSERQFRITIAVAGFTEDDLVITVEDNQLMVRGKQAEERASAYLHRGIAARQFQRSFVLASGLEVGGAALEDGLLHIDIDRPVPEPRARRIEINARAADHEPRLKTVEGGGGG